MPKRLIFTSDLSAIPQTPCPSAFRLKDMHCEMFQPENILQKNQFPKNWKDTGLAEGFQSRLKDSRTQFFSRKADGQGICEHAERFEGFFKVFYIEYYERPYLTFLYNNTDRMAAKLRQSYQSLSQTECL